MEDTEQVELLARLSGLEELVSSRLLNLEQQQAAIIQQLDRLALRSPEAVAQRDCGEAERLNMLIGKEPEINELRQREAEAAARRDYREAGRLKELIKSKLDPVPVSMARCFGNQGHGDH